MALPTQPTTTPAWATTPGSDPSTGNSYLSAPSPAKQVQGWVPEKPALQYFNWWMNLVGQWVIALTNRNPLTNMVTVTSAGAYSVPLGASIYLWMDTSAGNQSIGLPSITSADDGMIVRAMRVSGGSNTLTWNGTISGNVNPTIDNQYTEQAAIAKAGLWYFIA